MKLLSKFNRVNIMATIIVLMLSGICYYFLIRAILTHQLDKDLEVEEQEVNDFIKQNNRLPQPSNYKDLKEFFLPSGIAVARTFSSIDTYSNEHHENITYRQLQFCVVASDRNYKVVVRKSEKESENIIASVLKITLLLMAMLFITLFLINRFILSKLWKPFHTTLQQIDQFNLSGKSNAQLEHTNIEEFNTLNNALKIMISRVSQDYNEIKSFTENASHEIQTPLAIIKSKLELLTQSESLKEEQMNTVQSIHTAVNRLSKLNQSLILLTKIDNRQFSESEVLNLGVLVNNSLAYYEELIAAKNISIKKNIQENVKMVMNETLAEILVSNLITNAIKHNISNGSITINLSSKEFSISNTGLPLSCDPLELFERFKKDKVSSESLGLGLSIVKKIGERYHFNVAYHYTNLLHTTIISLSLINH